MKEDKKRTVELLAQLLESTRRYNDLICLKYVKYDNGEEIVIPEFANGKGNVINVSGDSCYALIIDVLKHIN